MTVGELKKLLENFDDNLRVCTSERKKYTPSYAYTITKIVRAEVDPFWSNSTETVACLVDDDQVGVIA